MLAKKVLFIFVFLAVISFGFLSIYALQIVAPETPRGGNNATDGFINSTEISNVQIIVNFTTTATNPSQGASIGDQLYLLNGTIGNPSIQNFTGTDLFVIINATEFNQKSYNFTLTSTRLPDGPYELHAQINNGTAGLISSGLSFIVDTIGPILTITTPTSSSSINDVNSTASDITWSTNEALSKGNFTITRTGGTADGGSPRTCILTGTALNTGAHNNFQLNNTANSCVSDVSAALVNGAIYTFSFNATDLAGNEGAIITRTGVTFDTSAPTFIASTTTTITTTVTFNEAINGGSFVAGDWKVAGVAATGIAPSGAASGQTSVVLTHAAIGVNDTPSIQYTPGNLADSAGNTVIGATITATDGIANTGGSGGGNNQPPSFTKGFSEDESPLTFNGQEIDVSNFENKVDVTTLKTGETTNLTLLFYDDDNIDYVGLYTNLRDSERQRHQSDTIIEWRSNGGLSVTDPHGYFEDAKVIISDKGNKNEFSFDITFANRLEKSDLIVYVWDEKRNSVQTRILDFWQVIESPKSSLITEPESITDVAETNASISEPALSPTLKVVIDSWAGYSKSTASDSEMLQSIGLDGKYIPSWAKELGEWVNKGLIDEVDFINAIKNLHERRIVN